MSGVCAIFSRTGDQLDRDELVTMVGAAPHRSTAGNVHHAEPHVLMAQLSRTSRTDAAVSAPRRHAATGIVVISDARIDNGAGLRHALGPEAPTPYAGASALILACYLRWGAAALPRLIGDFAFVIWDPRYRRLLLARDPFGMRALFYAVACRRVLIATEVKQILAVPGMSSEPDERMAGAFLSGSFGSMDWSYYRDVAQVAPGHVVQFEGTRVHTRRYWDIDPERRIDHRAPGEYAEELRELFLEAVRARLRPEQPAGILLSGGIDSGAAASAAGWLLEREPLAPQLRSYSWDFGSLTMCDERAISQHIIDRYAITATDVPVEDAGPLAGYPAHSPDLDDPFHGHFQTMLDRGFAKAQADGIGPLFTGMRGDLAIGPIDVDYQSLLRKGHLPALAGELRRHRRATEEGLLAIARRDIVPMAVRLGRRSRAANNLRWAIGRSQHRPDSIRARDKNYATWIEPRFAERIGLTELIDSFGESPAPALDGPLRRRRYEWIFMPMHLRWAVSHERRVASFGMEAVDPWSDRRIAEFCIAVPQQALDQPYSVDKQLVRDALVGIMPQGFLDAAGKTVPTPLFRETLRGPAAPAVRELLNNSRAEAAGWIRTDSLLADYERFRGAGGQPDPQLWWMLSLEWWLRQLETK